MYLSEEISLEHILIWQNNTWHSSPQLIGEEIMTT